MPTWASWILRVRRSFSVAALTAALAHGAEQEPLPVLLHPLVGAAEALYRGNLPEACGELVKQADGSHGLTSEDRIHLRFLNALRNIEDGDERAARMVISQVLRANPSATPPPFASRLGKLVREIRT